MIKLLIDEEYGCRTWLAELSQEEYTKLIARWETMRGLFCSVPVQLVIPQAIKVFDEQVCEMLDKGITFYSCHMHECDDSHLQGSSYKIPDDGNFWMEGRKYAYDEFEAYY